MLLNDILLIKILNKPISSKETVLVAFKDPLFEKASSTVITDAIESSYITKFFYNNNLLLNILL